MTEYIAVPDDEEQLTDWFAGAYGSHRRSHDESFWDWDQTDAILTFTDTGPRDTDDGPKPRAQLVIYLDPRGGGSRRAVGASLEIDPADARRIAERLLRWADGVGDDNPATPSLDDGKGNLYSVEVSGVVTLAFSELPSDRDLKVAAVENLLDIVEAAGGPDGFVDHYENNGTTVEFIESVTL